MDVRKEKAGEFIALFDTYGEILTAAQRDVCKKYLEYDLSLGEIAEEKGVSRQSVSDSLKKSCERLKSFENGLGAIALKERLAKIERLCKEAEQKVRGAKKSVGALQSVEAKKAADCLDAAARLLKEATECGD